MEKPFNEPITCIRCGHRWTVDLTRLRQATKLVYKGDLKPVRVETFRLVCPNCGAANMLDVAFEETPNA